ncbi:MAG: hypothetical protein HQ471_00345 [Flavobacteriales bacterium]|nr:hypothetical protein [Flavobacteriales bacterium]
MIREKKLNEAVMECYIRLYKASVPSVDFNDLIKNAKINEQGQKEIPYNDYLIDFDLETEIINGIIKEYKIGKFYANRFKATIYLGCSPKYKLKE